MPSCFIALYQEIDCLIEHKVSDNNVIRKHYV